MYRRRRHLVPAADFGNGSIIWAPAQDGFPASNLALDDVSVLLGFRRELRRVLVLRIHLKMLRLLLVRLSLPWGLVSGGPHLRRKFGEVGLLQSESLNIGSSTKACAEEDERIWRARNVSGINGRAVGIRGLDWIRG